MIEEAHDPIYPETSAKGRILTTLQTSGVVRVSELMEKTRLKRPAIRTAIKRLRDDGWDIICKRDTSGGFDPKYELLVASSLPNQERQYKPGDKINVN